ncbi:hypothetical protein NP233_g3959 [Leucocoprinus birnbaumii]|uniref:Uncharacterized protein n=1 Tax=Leucocoprinus birnbaumii TaxID=56174 RepID=A0AAD5YXL0_9AGAR|nr:hypothetical protein NP233_g3959 [Leucocoprinus birnbaumii]
MFSTWTPTFLALLIALILLVYPAPSSAAVVARGGGGPDFTWNQVNHVNPTDPSQSGGRWPIAGDRGRGRS